LSQLASHNQGRKLLRNVELANQGGSIRCEYCTKEFTCSLDKEIHQRHKHKGIVLPYPPFSATTSTAGVSATAYSAPASTMHATPVSAASGMTPDMAATGISSSASGGTKQPKQKKTKSKSTNPTPAAAPVPRAGSPPPPLEADGTSLLTTKAESTLATTSAAIDENDPNAASTILVSTTALDEPPALTTATTATSAVNSGNGTTGGRTANGEPKLKKAKGLRLAFAFYRMSPVSDVPCLDYTVSCFA
jgi:hypothetical protein